jgi:hypothetical protein
MAETLASTAGPRHLTTDDRCVVLADGVRYYASHIQAKISINWVSLCDAIGEEFKLKKLGQRVVQDRRDVPIKRLAEAAVWADKLAKLPYALGAVSPFSYIVQSFWASVHDRLKDALRELEPRPTEISASLKKQLDVILAEHTSLGEVATLVVHSGGYAHCEFPPHISQFIKKYAPPLVPDAAEDDEETGLPLNDPSHAERFVDKHGVAALLTWLGRPLEPNSVKDFTIPGRREDTTLLDHEAYEKKGQHQYLYRLSSVIEWLKANKDTLELNVREKLPKTGIDFYFENDTAMLGKPPRKAK